MKLLLLIAFIPVAVFCLTDEVYDNFQVSDEKIDLPECDENEVWMECASCEETCGNPKPKQCPRVCQPARCQCPAHKGFRRNASGDCIKC